MRWIRAWYKSGWLGVLLFLVVVALLGLWAGHHPDANPPIPTYN